MSLKESIRKYEEKFHHIRLILRDYKLSCEEKNLKIYELIK